jgi:hypothetical protein
MRSILLALAVAFIAGAFFVAEVAAALART